MFMLSGTVFIRCMLPNLPELNTVQAMAAQFSAPEALSGFSLSHPVLHFLLIGQDGQGDERNGRSDAMLLCSYYKESNTFYITSLMRDLYLPIPGYGSDRLNAAYAFGGSELLCKTLEKNFGLTVDGWVEVDFDSFCGIVDLLGGITLELQELEAATINAAVGGNLSEGMQHLTGAQILAYSRIRKLDVDGDFSRTNRQRKILTALLDAYRDVGIRQSLSVLNALLPMVTTNLNTLSMLSYALEILPNIRDIQFVSRCLPAEGTYTDEMIDGMAVLVPDWTALRQTLEEYFPAQ